MIKADVSFRILSTATLRTLRGIAHLWHSPARPLFLWRRSHHHGDSRDLMPSSLYKFSLACTAKDRDNPYRTGQSTARG